jgi:DNA-binding transcriptional ArsR family regulator
VAPRADSAALNVQPRQRRRVYEALAEALDGAPPGRSVKELLAELDMPEPEVRSSLRKLDEAGLAVRVKGRWTAVPLDGSEAASAGTPETV